MPRLMPSQERLRELLDYDMTKGSFTVRSTGRPLAASRHNGHWMTNIDRRSYRVHRLIWIWMTGENPPPQIDHIDGDGTNNAWNNLRAATDAQNHQNQRCRADNLAGLKGVSLTYGGKIQRYRAKIYVGPKLIWLGTFATAEEAHAAYCAAAMEHFGEFWNPGWHRSPTEKIRRSNRLLS